MKLLLINPPKEILLPRIPFSRWFPLGLAYVGAAARVAGADVCIFDSFAFPEDSVVLDTDSRHPLSPSCRPGIGACFRIGASWDRLQGVLESYRPDLVGISCLMTAHRREVLELAGKLKRFDSKLCVIAGGTDFTFSPNLYMDSPNIDFGIRGDGECGIGALIRALEGGPLRDVPGILYRQKKKCVMRPIAYVSEADFEALRPALDMLPMEKWFGLAGSRFAMMVTSRGCSNRCRFCSQRNQFYRMRSARNVLTEIEELTTTYAIDTILFEDDMLLADHERAVRIFEGIGQLTTAYRIYCFSGVSVDTIDKDLAVAMKAAGVQTLPFGLETRQEPLRTRIGKPFLRLDQFEHAVATCRDAGIPDVRAFLIAGLPKSSLEDCLDDIEYVFQLGIRANLNAYYPVPETPLYDEVRQGGYLFSEDPSHFRAAFGNVHTREFPRNDLLLLVDYYHALKFASQFSSLEQCLDAAGCEIKSDGSEVHRWDIIAHRSEYEFVPMNSVPRPERLCEHAARRLEVFLSLFLPLFVRIREVECRFDGSSDECRFVAEEDTDCGSVRALILSRLRQCYVLYRRANDGSCRS